MGGGIAEVCAKAGVDVIVVEVTEELADRSKAGINRSLDKAVDRGKLDSDGREAALALLTFTTDLGAFVRVGTVEGLLHNQDCTWDKSTKARDLYKVGDEVEVKIVKINHEEEKIYQYKAAGHEHRRHQCEREGYRPS